MTKLCIAALALVAIAITADAHFTLAGSREAAQWQTNVKYFPLNLRGDYGQPPITDCLTLPALSPQMTLTAGSTATLPFEIGNGAAHVGECTAELIDLTSGTHTPLPAQHDCVAQAHAYSFPVPSVTCTKCVVKVKVTAVHLGPSKPEFYDSCLDVSVAGGSGPIKSMRMVRRA